MRIAVLGAGKMAAAIVHDLTKNDDITEIVLGDVVEANPVRLKKRLRSKKITPLQVDVTSKRKLRGAIAGTDCVVGATTYGHNLALTEAAIQVGAHFCDLGGNNDVVRAQHKLSSQARAAGVTVIPDCGVAPGMVNVLAYHWAQPFDRVEHLRIRVGGLPKEPTNDLRYQLVFSVEGLINEYIEKAEILRDGKKRLVPGLTDVEELCFEAPYERMEAFYTSGGTSTLPKTLGKKVSNLDYKTIRYPGHAARFKTLIDLGLCENVPVPLGKTTVVPRQLTAKLLSERIPHDQPDVVIMRIELEGEANDSTRRVRFDSVDHYDKSTGLTAMQRTTGFAAAIVAQMLAAGQVRKKGVTHQELAIPGEPFVQELQKRGIAFHESTF